MDTEPMVDTMLEDGQKLIELMQQDGLEVLAACWLHPYDRSKWNFYIVVPAVETEGRREASFRLHPIRQKMPGSLAASIFRLHLVGPSSPLGRDILAAAARLPKNLTRPIRWGGHRMGNMMGEQGYFYPVPARVSGQSAAS